MAFPYFIFELLFPLVEALVWVAIPVLLVVGVLSLMDTAGCCDDRSGGTALSLAAIAVEAAAFSFFHWSAGEHYRLVMLALLEPMGYRQCTLFFRLRTFVRYYREFTCTPCGDRQRGRRHRLRRPQRRDADSMADPSARRRVLKIIASRDGSVVWSGEIAQGEATIGRSPSSQGRARRSAGELDARARVVRQGRGRLHRLAARMVPFETASESPPSASARAA
jgi:hypothetical protein